MQMKKTYKISSLYKVRVSLGFNFVLFILKVNKGLEFVYACETKLSLNT